MGAITFAERDDVGRLEAIPFVDLPYPLCSKSEAAPCYTPVLSLFNVTCVRAAAIVSVGVYFIALVGYL